MIGEELLLTYPRFLCGGLEGPSQLMGISEPSPTKLKIKVMLMGHFPDCAGRYAPKALSLHFSEFLPSNSSAPSAQASPL
jgi:hypothetical protein